MVPYCPPPRINCRALHIHRFLIKDAASLIPLSKKGFPENKSPVENPCRLLNDISAVIAVLAMAFFSLRIIKSDTVSSPVLFHYPHMVSLIVKFTNFAIHCKIRVNEKSVILNISPAPFIHPIIFFFGIKTGQGIQEPSLPHR